MCYFVSGLVLFAGVFVKGDITVSHERQATLRNYPLLSSILFLWCLALTIMERIMLLPFLLQHDL